MAVALTINGRKVIILIGSIDDQSVHTENIEVETDGKILNAEITISSISNCDSLNGIVLLTNKSFGNAAVAEKLKDKAKNSPIVFFKMGCILKIVL